MRAPRFRPGFDALDARITLSDSGATLASGAGAGSAMVGSNNPSATSSDVDYTGMTNWYQGGTPPAQPYDPCEAPVTDM